MDGEQTKPDPETPKPRSKVRTEATETPDIKAMIADAVKQHGDLNVAYLMVSKERDTLRDELGATKERLPKEGHVVLDPDGAKRWADYQALGEPSALSKRIADGEAAATERDDLKFQSHIGEVAGLAKWKPKVLADRIKASGIETLIKEEPDPKDPKGAKLRVPHVKLEGDKTTPLADYAKEHWGDYLPALQAEPAKAESLRGSPSFTGANPARPPVVVKTDQPRRSLVR